MHLPSAQLGLDIFATTVFLGGAILLLANALFTYMGLLPLLPERRRSAYYAGKHALITGGSSGIGKELARLLVASGASVTLVARNHHRLLRVREELKPAGEDAAPAARLNVCAADCADGHDVDRMVHDVEQQWGQVDVLFNCVGGAVGGYFEESTEAHFRQQLDANYFAALLPTRAVFARMATRGGGHIVLVSSMSGLTGVFGQSAYCAAKFAVRGLAETLFYEGKPYGVDVTVVYPPDTDTPGLQEEVPTMPPATLQISETAGLFSPERVAREIVNAVMRRRFRVTVGIIGNLLGVLTAGLTPGVSFSDVLLMPIARAITPFFIWDNNRVVARNHVCRVVPPTPQAATEKSP